MTLNIFEIIPYFLLGAWLLFSIYYLFRAARNPDKVNPYIFESIPQVFPTIGILGTFMGIAPTGKRVRIPYMDFWQVVDGRIKDNPVFVDFASVCLQLGQDVFRGEGWEVFDKGERRAPPTK